MRKTLVSIMIISWMAVFTALVLAVTPANAMMAVAQYATCLFNVCGGMLMLAMVWER